ncbi:MAG: tetratricopeptide repeat protein [Roseiflexaceae bacterium]
MASEQTGAESRRGRPDVLGWIAHALLLVPEAALIAALLCAYWGMGAPAQIGLAIMLVIISFIARMIALVAARVALELEQPEIGATLVRLALALNPWSPDALALRGVIALSNDQPARAEVSLRRAIALLPNRANMHAALSAALLDLGRPEAAAEAAHTALALEPDCAIAHFYLAEAERVCGAPAQDIEDQLRSGLECAGAPESEAALRCALGAHLLAEHRIAEATLTLHGAEALVPRCAAPRQIALRVRLGELMIAQGQVERAREQFRNVATLDPHGRYAGAAWRASHLL